MADKNTNNDIKEILDDLKNEDNYIEDYGFRYKRIALDDVWHLLDYITNLQEHNKQLVKDILNQDKKIDKTIEYIEENKPIVNASAVEDILRGEDNE